MPIDDDYGGMNTGMAVHNFGYRLRFYQPKPGDRSLSWGLSRSEPRPGSMGGPIALEDIPEMFRAPLQDWIALAQSQPSKAGDVPK